MRHQLLLVRHAKSAWDDPSLADHDRPLAPRGHKAIRRLQEYFEQTAPSPEIVLCSSSRRTIETLDGIRAMLGDPSIEVDKAIYEAPSDTLLAGVRLLDERIGCAMMIGHNPGMQDFAMWLAGSGDATMLAQLAMKFPTGAVATLSFEGSWGGLSAGAARLDDLFMPRRPRP